jgi:phage gpG-like protein
MTLNEKIKQIEALSKKMEGFMKTTMPRLAGRLAINHFEANFIKGGWQDGALTKWKTTVRQTAGGGNAASNYGPLTSANNRLKGSFTARESDYRVTVENTAPYAKYHNEGAETPVTPRMKKFAWHKYFEAAGIRKGEKQQQQGEPGGLAGMWKAIALKKVGSTIHLPQRRFMGKAAELKENVIKTGLVELKKLLAS